MKKYGKNIIFYLICLYVILLPFTFSFFSIKGKAINADIIFALIVIMYLVKLLINKKTKKIFIRGFKDFFTNPTSLFMLLLLLSMLFSVTYSLPAERKLAFSEGVRFFSYIIIFFIVKYEINNEKYYTNIFKCIIPVIVFQTIIGIIQGTTGKFLNEQFIYDTGEFISRYRITGTFDNPNAYGAYLMLFIFPLLMLFINEKNKKKKISLGCILILMLINIVMTFSRNALLGFGIGILVLIIIYSWKLLWILVAAGVCGVFIPKINLRISQIINSSQNDLRFKLWKIAGKIIKEHTIKGVGNGNYLAYYDIYVKKYPELKCVDHWRYPVHNSYLKVFSELGIIGFIPFLGIIISIFLKLKSMMKKNTKYKMFISGIMASFIVFMIMNFFDNLLFVPKVTGYFWVIIAICEGMYIKKR